MKNWDIYRKLGIVYGVIWSFMYTRLDGNMKIYTTFPMYLLFIISSVKKIKNPNSTEKEKSGNKRFLIFILITLVLNIIRLIRG